MKFLSVEASRSTPSLTSLSQKAHAEEPLGLLHNLILLRSPLKSF